MATTKKKAASKGAAKGGEKKAAKKSNLPAVKAKYDYPKDCTTDADKKKYRSLMRQGKEWGGGTAKAGKKKDHGPAKSVTFNKGKKKEIDHPGEKAAKKKAKPATSED